MSTDNVLVPRRIIGIGMLNIDYIGRAPVDEQGWAGSIVAAMSASMPQMSPPLGWNTERISPDHPIQAPSWAIPPDEVTISLGGSAFNAVHALASMDLGVELGYVGMLGESPPAAPSFESTFDAFDIDHSFVRQDPRVPTGVCLSLMENGEPTMVTYAGANAGMAGYLESELDAVANYLAGASMVHVTSLLDQVSPSKLIPVVQAAKRINPNLIISFDPGYEWCSTRNRVLDGVGSVSDIVSMSRAELRAAVPGTVDDYEAAGREVLDRYMAGSGVLVLRSPDQVKIFRVASGSVDIETLSHAALHTTEIIDATGAGDAFAAGFIAGYLADPVRLDVAARLGMRLARTHLQHIGSSGYQYFADIAAEALKGRLAATVRSDS